MDVDLIQKQYANKWLGRVRSIISAKHQNSVNSLGQNYCSKGKSLKDNMIVGVSWAVSKKILISLKVKKSCLLRQLSSRLKYKKFIRVWYRGKIMQLRISLMQRKKNKGQTIIGGGCWRSLQSLCFWLRADIL